jgi:isoleucyl-tRNA synthetase
MSICNLFDDIPFENVVTTGTILSEDGQKMSKSKNNYLILEV